MADEVQYFAHYGNPPEDTPWALFMTVGPHAYRYVKHRDEYAELDGSWDYVSGFSSDSMGRRRITPEQARTMEADIPDVDPAVVLYRNG